MFLMQPIVLLNENNYMVVFNIMYDHNDSQQQQVDSFNDILIMIEDHSDYEYEQFCSSRIYAV